MAGASAEPLLPVGRELVRELGNPVGLLLHFIARHPRTQSVLRHRVKVLLLLVVGRLLWTKRKKALLQAAAVAAAEAKAETPIADAPEPAHKAISVDTPAPPAGQAINVQRPSAADIITGGGSFFCPEAVGCAVMCVVASYAMRRKGTIIGRIMELGQTRSKWSEWKWAAWQYPVISIALAVLLEGTEYLRLLVENRWRRSATSRLHDLYFSQMGYYRLQNQRKDLAVEDPDARICTDIKLMVQAHAALTFSLLKAGVFSLMLGRFSIKDRSWRWSLAPPAFFIVGVISIGMSMTDAMNWAQSMIASSESRYQQLLTRTQLHAERIFVLQGEGCELALLRRQVDKIKEWSRVYREVSFMKDGMNSMFFEAAHPGFIELAGHVQEAFMGANDVIRDTAEYVDALPLDPTVPRIWTPGHMGVQLINLTAWFNACRGWGLCIATYFSLQSLEVNTNRVKDLYAKLKALQQQQAVSGDVFSDLGALISFDNVTIQTPMQQTLLKHLTFSIKEGEMLLICGHNGAGKSSIIRSLCSLWPIPEGSIARPGGAVQAEEEAHLHDEVYYLPQKPCNVLGSLSDQLTYPIKVQGGLPDKELRCWLRYVDLEYLADRQIGADAVSRVPGGDGTEIDWEVLLSLGEQQALSIARLLYHRPRFAILDECTSAVGKALERRLFEVAREIGVSCITITHRPALKEHHQRLLQLTGALKEDDRGWQLTDLPDAGRAVLRTRAESKDEVVQRIEAYLEANRRTKRATPGVVDETATDHDLLEKRSAEYVHWAVKEPAVSAEAIVRQRWPGRFARFVAVLRLALGSPGQRREAARLMAIMSALLGLHVRCVWWLWRGQTGMMVASMCGNKSGIWYQCFGNVLLTLFTGLVDQAFKHQVFRLCTELWAGVSKELLQRAMKDGSFIKVMNPASPSIPVVENPIQRLSELKMLFSTMEYQIDSVTLMLSTAIYLLPMMLRGVGIWSPVLLTFNYLAFSGCQRLAPNFAALQREETMLEGRFQFLHSRLRSIAEPVAFSGGGGAERRIIEPRFDAVIRHKEKAIPKEFWFNVVVNYFTDYMQLPVWTQRLLSRYFAYYNNPLHPDGFTPQNVVCNFFFDRTVQYPQIAVQRIVQFVPQWERMDGYCLRCLELVGAFDAVAANAPSPTPAAAWAAGLLPAGSAVNATPGGGRIKVQRLDVVTKTGSCLAQGLTFEVSSGSPLLITGPNATGKSLLGSVLLGLWAPSGKDHSVSMPGAVGRRPPLRTIMPAPQRIYLPSGRLLDQLAYPAVTHEEDLQAPFRMELRGGVREESSLKELRARLERLGVTEISLDPAADQESCVAVACFASGAVLLKALARPHVWNINGHCFEADFCRDEAEIGDSPLAGTSLLPYMPRMLRALEATDILHVLEREPLGWLAEQVWEDILSGGEQQRMCFARVLYHGPVFGLLDECTSMVSADAEENLYRKLFNDWKITPITLTQRMFMPDLYRQELSLGARCPHGWELCETTAG